MASRFRNVKIDLFTDIDVINGRKRYKKKNMSLYQYAKANIKYMKDYDKNKESLYIQFLDVNNLYGWAMWQKLLVNNFEWIRDTS